MKVLCSGSGSGLLIFKLLLDMMKMIVGVRALLIYTRLDSLVLKLSMVGAEIMS